VNAETIDVAVSDFPPTLNAWFNASGEYTGPAEFRVEGGPLIRGEGVITWDADGWVPDCC
jgi:hypothetical protein